MGLSWTAERSADISARVTRLALIKAGMKPVWTVGRRAYKLASRKLAEAKSTVVKQLSAFSASSSSKEVDMEPTTTDPRRDENRLSPWQSSPGVY